MSGSFPTAQGFQSVTITSFTPTLQSVSHSMKRQVRQRGGQRWAFKATLPPLSQTQHKEVFAFLVNQKGRFESFLFTPPASLSNSDGAETQAVSVNGAHAAGVSSVACDGFTASLVGALAAGDFIKFSGHTKVYMVKSNVDPDGTGAATVTIEPPLSVALADNETVTYDAVSWTVALAGDVAEMKGGLGDIYNLSLDVVEVV